LSRETPVQGIALMSNVAGFDEFDSDLEIDAHSRGLPRVILEGPTDLWLFRDIWFANYQAKFDFMPASRLVDGDGCTAVPRAVEKSWQAEVPAFGILDRDVYFRDKNWDALYEGEEDKFRSFETDDTLFVSEFWEIEAHLIFPDRLAPWVIGCSRDAIKYGHLAAEALDRSLEQCEILFDAAPYLAATHFDKKPSSTSFGGLLRADVQRICEQQLATLSDAARTEADHVVACIARVRAEAPADAGAKLRYYLKFIDTKRLLDRLSHALHLHHDRDNQNTLAAFMMDRAEEPEEFSKHLAALIERVEKLDKQTH
jgi:hypothetical protein